MKKTMPDGEPATRRASSAASVDIGDRQASSDAATGSESCSLEAAMKRRDELLEEALGCLRTAVRDIADALESVLGGMVTRQRAPASLDERHASLHARSPTVAGALNEITLQLRQLELSVRAASGGRRNQPRGTPPAKETGGPPSGR